MNLGITYRTISNAGSVLVDVLNKFGFCSSYSEVQKYKWSAGFHQSTDIRGAVSLDRSWK